MTQYKLVTITWEQCAFVDTTNRTTSHFTFLIPKNIWNESKLDSEQEPDEGCDLENGLKYASKEDKQKLKKINKLTIRDDVILYSFIDNDNRFISCITDDDLKFQIVGKQERLCILASFLLPIPFFAKIPFKEQGDEAPHCGECNESTKCEVCKKNEEYAKKHKLCLKN
jgi:hypothetical protein